MPTRENTIDSIVGTEIAVTAMLLASRKMLPPPPPPVLFLGPVQPNLPRRCRIRAPKLSAVLKSCPSRSIWRRGICRWTALVPIRTKVNPWLPVPGFSYPTVGWWGSRTKNGYLFSFYYKKMVKHVIQIRLINIRGQFIKYCCKLKLVFNA